jgi:hypothetical protein
MASAVSWTIGPPSAMQLRIREPPSPLRSHPRPPSACPRHTAGTIAIPAAPNPEELLLHRHAALAKLDGCHAHTSDLGRSRPWFPSSVPWGPGVSGPAWIRCGPQERRRQNGDWPNSRLALFKVATHGYWRSREPAQRIGFTIQETPHFLVRTCIVMAAPSPNASLWRSHERITASGLLGLAWDRTCGWLALAHEMAWPKSG